MKNNDNDVRSWAIYETGNYTEYERLLKNTGIELPTELLPDIPNKIRLVTIHPDVFVRITKYGDEVVLEIYPNEGEP